MSVFKSSVHFILKKKSDYKDLAPVFEDILTGALTIADQMPPEEEFAMILRINMEDLENNRKPEGYIRKARIKMVFPIDRKEFYFQSFSPKNVDLSRIRENTAEILGKAGIDYEITEDDDIKFALPSKKR